VTNKWLIVDFVSSKGMTSISKCTIKRLVVRLRLNLLVEFYMFPQTHWLDLEGRELGEGRDWR